MWALGPIGFATPWLLLALAGLPVLWWLLRAVPPAPIRRRFPGVVLLLGLEDRNQQSDRTPWWLLLLRMLAVAGLIIGLAGPVLNPDRAGLPRSGPLLVFIDNGWAAAPDWAARIEAVDAALAEAAQDGRPVAVVLASDVPGEGLPLRPAGEWRARLAGLEPVAWAPGYGAAMAWAPDLPGTEVLWLSDGLDHEGRATLLAMYQRAGDVTVAEPPAPRLGLLPPRFEDGAVKLELLRSAEGGERTVQVAAIGPDPNGIERTLARAELTLAPGALRAETALTLPPELRNRLTRFEVEGMRSAGSVALADDSLRRRRVALVGGADREGLELLSPLHYLRQALEPTAELIEGALNDLIQASPDVVILADVATLAEPDQRALAEWVAQGGLLLRFAGPRLAASDVGRGIEDILLPVRLRAGGRNVGGAMSWGSPRALAPFSDQSPFHGLAVPDDVLVSAQVLAEPGPDLGERTIAALADGTPLVTRKALGEGAVVLVHVSANAEWSTLPLSGLFVQMLERLAVSTRPTRPEAETLAGTTWQAEQLLDGFGMLVKAEAMAGVEGERLAGLAGPDLPPGLYAEADRRIAVNALGAGAQLAPANWPAGVVPVWDVARAAQPLGHLFLLAALLLLLVDILAALRLSGRLGGAVAALALIGLIPLSEARAQEGEAVDPAQLAAAAEVTLAHILTGDADLDALARAGLDGLAAELTRRSSVEPAPTISVNVEADDLSLFPLLYWPISATQPLPSPAAYGRLNRYLAGGGLILFDTRDGNLSGTGGSTPAGQRLRALAAPLDVPPLEPIPLDHVLTRTFYLLGDFPGRYAGQPVWAEAAPPDAEQAEGMPFRNLNDGVTPVIIGGNDWAGAWALDAGGRPLLPVGRGGAGERQREMAYRFGVNLVMHVLTGNYKSDQVHVPALLERLGQ
ncbi:DUF4159 domain-containing protein [Aliiroseovarius sp.]|uniref:DUF4159 domain-containing protein n=1 Tax=Aliiroseovarius sp. TaxID=1872442 RepID=UPI002639A899|nr:DUF4159 domain-containing protein [Aliiroseovarius sp.]